MIVPSPIAPYNGFVARLGDGRFCADVNVFDPESGLEGGNLTAEIGGRQTIAKESHTHPLFRER